MPTAILTNLMILLTFAVAAALFAIDPDLYYRSAQEDAWLEWLTFSAFVVAAAGFVRHAIRDRRRRGGLPWFGIGLGLFCMLVALEEISWGQRLLGYLPPDYFLEQNYQQEFNLHNVLATELRVAALQLILIGYGVLLSALTLNNKFSDWLSRVRVVAPPPILIPGFIAMSVIYAWYPQNYTGEWVECAMGLGFTFIAALTAAGNKPRRVLWALSGVIILTALAVSVQRFVRGSDAERSDVARTEIGLLVNDFAGPKLHTACGIHKRLYTFMREYNQPFLIRGEFAAKLRDSGAHARANYLLDPWNAPYWVRHQCSSAQTVAFVYSFGPNGRRDSTEWELQDDDIGGYYPTR